MKKLAAALVFAAFSGLSCAYSAEGTFAFGIGTSYRFFSDDQQWKDSSGNIYEQRMTGSSLGTNLFVDLTRFFSLTGGVRFALGQLNFPDAYNVNSESWNLIQYEFGAEFKVPVGNRYFSFSPKIGIDYTGYLSGQVAGSGLTSDEQNEFSPLYLILGTNIDIFVDEHSFFRIPINFGVSLNSQLSNSYYNSAYTLDGSPGTYYQSYNSSFTIGFEYGYTIGEVHQRRYWGIY